MDDQALLQLSKDVAKKYNIPPACDYGDICENIVYLHEDRARCFDLMVEHNLFPSVYWNGTDNPLYSVMGYELVETGEHNNDRHLAVRVVILKSLLKKD